LTKRAETPTEREALAAGFEPADEAKWRALVDKVLKGADFERRLVSRTDDGIAIGPLYTRGNVVPGAEDSIPGVAPFARGFGGARHPRGWRIAQIRTEQDPAALGAAIADDVAGGVEAITIRLQAPGQTGLAADFRALEAALTNVPLDKVRLSLMPGKQSIHGGLALTGVARALGAAGSVAGLGIDPLGTLARTGDLHLMRPGVATFTLSPPWPAKPGATLVADARPYHEAGGSEAQELAALAATLVAYLRALEGEGLAPRDAIGRIALHVAVDADLFLGIAKLRAARRLVWRVAEACGAGEAARGMSLSVTTSERMMTRRDPWVNLLRTTAACAAAAIGGADEIAVLPFSWPLGEPDAFARRIARNVGLVLREEASLGLIADPAGGSWHLEQLTEDLARKGWTIFQDWEREGGMLAALAGGRVQDEIAAVAEARTAKLASGKIELTGTSAFPRLGDDGMTVTPWPAAPPLPSDPAVRPLPARRLAEPFETLRERADAAGTEPRIFIAPLGTPAEHGPRVTWTANLLASGGIGVIAGDGFTASGESGRAFAESGASVACICGTDQSYAELGEATAMALKSAGARKVYLAGFPGTSEAAPRVAGVDGFLHAGIDRIAALEALQRDLGLAEG
jgi:methylmalonyl-CoA mutase